MVQREESSTTPMTCADRAPAHEVPGSARVAWIESPSSSNPDSSSEPTAFATVGALDPGESGEIGTSARAVVTKNFQHSSDGHATEKLRAESSTT